MARSTGHFNLLRDRGDLLQRRSPHFLSKAKSNNAYIIRDRENGHFGPLHRCGLIKGSAKVVADRPFFPKANTIIADIICDRIKASVTFIIHLPQGGLLIGWQTAHFSLG
jgi:hypothetical protein